MTCNEAAVRLREYQAAQRVKRHHLPFKIDQALTLAISALIEKEEDASFYDPIRPGVTLYYVNEAEGIVEACSVIKIQTSGGKLSYFVVRFFSTEKTLEFLCSAFGTDLFLDEDDAIQELEERHVNSDDDEDPDDEDLGDSAASVDGTNYDSLQEAIEAADAGATIKMHQDTVISSKMTLNKSMIFDLHGNTLKGEGSNGYIAISGGADVTFQNTKGDSKISNAGEKWAIQVSGGSTVNLAEGVTVESPNATTAILLSGGNLVLDGGCVINDVSQGIHAQSKSNVTINQGSVRSGGYAVKVQSGSTLLMEGGVLRGEKGGVDAYGDGTVTIISGTVISNGYSIAAWDTIALTIDGNSYINGACGIITNGSATPSNQGVTINVRNGIIEGEYTGVYLPAGTMTIRESAIVRGKAGIVVRGGNLRILGGSINAVGTNPLSIGDAGYTIPVAGIAVDKNTKYNGGNVDVVINGGDVGSTSGMYSINFTDNGVSNVAESGISVSAGTFSDDSAKYYVSEGYKIVKDNTSGKYVVQRDED